MEPRTSAYVSTRQHTPACVRICQNASAYVSMHQHTPAYASIRQHTSAYARPGVLCAACEPIFALRCNHQQPASASNHLTHNVRLVRIGHAQSQAATASAYVSIRQHTSAHVSIRQHTSAHVSIRQHTSAYASPASSHCVSIRQHTSAYVSICEHT
jgi:hypothetical protein